jgi:hypothetical protein
LFPFLGCTYLASLALCLESRSLDDEDAVDLQEDRDALVSFGWRDRRHGRLGDSLDRCLYLHRLTFDLRREVEAHGLLLTVGRRQGGGRMLLLRRSIWLALVTQGRGGGLTVLGELLVRR